MTTTQHDLTSTWVPINTLTPHPRNPRNGDTDTIAESLRINHQYRPIVTTHDGTILAGNHTYAAAMQLGWTHIATVTLNIDPNTPAARRIMLADNRTADLGTYDHGLLLDLLSDMDADLTGTGYTDTDLLSLIPDDTPLDLTNDLDPPNPTTTLTLTVDPPTATNWRTHRANYTNDTTALDALLGSA